MHSSVSSLARLHRGDRFECCRSPRKGEYDLGPTGGAVATPVGRIAAAAIAAVDGGCRAGGTRRRGARAS